MGSKNLNPRQAEPKRVLMTKYSITILRADYKIVATRVRNISNKMFKDVDYHVLDLDLKSQITKKKYENMVDICKSFHPFVIQITTPSQLILWHLRQDKEMRSLNNY
jgi:hypothetical protein